MTAAAPLMLHRETVQAGWVDYNDHLNDAYYVVVFSNATTTLMDHIGLGEAERRRTGHSLFTLEMHVNYLREVKGGAEVRIATQVLGHDQKRLHVFHVMFEAGTTARHADRGISETRRAARLLYAGGSPHFSIVCLALAPVSAELLRAGIQHHLLLRHDLDRN